MLILTNALSDRPDEGCLTVAANLVPRLQAMGADVMPYDTNGSFLKSLHRLRKNRADPILYLPFPVRPIAAALRIFLLAKGSGRPVNALLVLMGKMGRLERWLLRSSGAHVTVLSGQARRRYASFLPPERVHRLKAGVDTAVFHSVSREKTAALKRQHGFDPERPLMLHVGHLKPGRGLDALTKIDPAYQILLVASTLTRDEQDADLRRRLTDANVRIWDDFIPEIAGVYQMCDAYFFPVLEAGNCIDVPLSCLEAAACGKSVITTAYGEMAELTDKPGFYRLENLEAETINRTIARALGGHGGREAVLDYDWDAGATQLLEWERRMT